METTQLRYTPGAEGLLSPLLPWLSDNSVSEILMNKPGEIYVDKGGCMTKHVLPALDRVHIKRLFTFIANESNQSMDEASPLLSGNLYDGSRVQLVMSPAAKDYTLSIRRQSVKRLSLDDYRHSDFYASTRAFDMHAPAINYLSEDDHVLIRLHKASRWADFMEAAVHFKKNIVISGATLSGKTTYLNALIGHMPLSERIITLEDTYEIEIPHQNKVGLCAFKPSGRSLPVVSMQDLVQCSLRLRPDRLVMGEIRGAEVLDFISACSTGHEGSITTIHAQNPRVAFSRMVQLVRLNNLPSMRDEDIERLLNEVIDVVIQVDKTPTGRLSSWIHYKYSNVPIEGSVPCP